VSDPDEVTRRLAAESLRERHPTAWFERLYEAAAEGSAVVPWDREAPQVLLTGWAAGRSFSGGRALVVGAGLGMDAEFVASLGFATTAFDIAPTAVASARERFPASRVDYRVADLLDPPAEWEGAFDFVYESLTAQALPQPQRAMAIARVGPFVAPGGTLLVVSAAREPGEDVDGPPWPLTRAEIDAFATGDLRPVLIEQPDPGRWRAEFTRT
jgi:2-polyprenyl-3-methyl-5-hydroxy-6-metoxy-1,4-benzoquinol methylase